jgi:hypothetical protein
MMENGWKDGWYYRMVVLWGRIGSRVVIRYTVIHHFDGVKMIRE